MVVKEKKGGYMKFMVRLLKISIILMGSLMLSFCSTSINPGSGNPPADTVSPVLTITSPTNGQMVGVSYILQGTVTDSGSDVKAVYVKLNDGIYNQVNVSGGNWSTNISISILGVYTNYVYAMDNANNTNTVSFIWIIRDSIPSVIISAPVNGIYTNISNITLSGTASIDTPYSISNVQVQLNGGGWVNASGTVNWAKVINLTEGSNTIVARGISDNGKTNISAELTIVFEKVVFVSTTGNDGNSGGRTDPLFSLQAAVSKALAVGFNTIRVAEGMYSPGSGLNLSNSGVVLTNISGLSIIGGYSSDFFSHNGVSILNGADSLYHLVFIYRAQNIDLSGFTITHGCASGSGNNGYGGGVFIQYSYNIFITNSIISNNVSTGAPLCLGGGLFIQGGKSVTISGTISDNSAKTGGGIFVYEGTNHCFSATFIGNTATSYGGGVFVDTSGIGFNFSGTFYGNYSPQGGGIYLNYTSTNHTFNITIKSNAQYGIYKKGSSAPNLSGVIWGVGNETNSPANVGP